MRAESERRRLSPWVVAVVIGLGVVIAFNSYYAYVAISGADPVDPSYVTEPR